MRHRASRSLLALTVSMITICAGWPASVLSHESRPALMQITERPNHRYDILWKQPVMGDRAVRLVPHISGELLERPPSSVETTPSFHIRAWRDLDAGEQGLEGRTLRVEGLERTITDVFVSMTSADGKSTQHILRPENPSLTLRLGGRKASVPEFFVLGVQHILQGPDHLLFVLALLLIVTSRGPLIKTITAFTVAHSLTLAAATLGLIQMSVPLLNTLVALSILFIAPEVIRARRGGISLTIQYPWLAAFIFGLLHGLGFATGLSPLGLEKGALFTALLLFNLGVEAGQLAFIALVLVLMRSFRLMEIVWPRPALLLPAYVIGTLGAFWTFKYFALMIGES